MRSLLNNEFYDVAFLYNDCIVETVNGEAVDKVFILSAEEMKEKMLKYGSEVYESKPTEWITSYMENEEDWKYQGKFMLWTRDVALYVGGDYTHYIDDYGYITKVGLDSQDAWAIIRPAIWITTE